MLSLIRSLLAKPCPICQTSLDGARGLCAHCQNDLHPQLISRSRLTTSTEPHLICLGRFEQGLRRAVVAFKYGRSRDIAYAMAPVLASAIPSDWNISYICPVPLHPKREQERGFNQAGVLAREIARNAQLPYRELLSRTRYTRQQAKLSAQERQHNLDTAFQSIQSIQGNVLLVDDVLTTGQTLQSCSQVLFNAGANKIYYVVIAR